MSQRRLSRTFVSTPLEISSSPCNLHPCCTPHKIRDHFIVLDVTIDFCIHLKGMLQSFSLYAKLSRIDSHLRAVDNIPAQFLFLSVEKRTKAVSLRFTPLSTICFHEKLFFTSITTEIAICAKPTYKFHIS